MAAHRSNNHADLPRYADTIVVGGGTAGAAIAGTLAARSDESVLLLEAGPDYGPFAAGGWPGDLLDAGALPASHQWGYDSGECYPERTIPFERARVIGGCSAHNGCAAIWGSRHDYDGWAALGNPGWATADLLPYFRAASDRLRVRQPSPDEVTPYQQAFLDAAPGAGIPRVADLNDFDQDIGMAPSPANIVDGVRWNTAFAYLDPVRMRPNLAIRGNVLADRLVIRHGRVAGVAVVTESGRETIEAGRVVIAAGTYGSPAILLRSGVGDPDELRAVGIEAVHALPGVGRNLHDHPAIMVRFAGTPELKRRMAAFATEHWLPEEQTIAKARSSHCGAGFDLHLYPVGGPLADAPSGWWWALPFACMTPHSRGALRLVSADPTAAPRIDHRYLSDPDGADRRVLAEGLALAREFAAQPTLAALLGAEIEPGPAIRGADETAAYIAAACVHYYHPVGTCKMGAATDPQAVVNARGAIHGLAGAYIADCSIMPVIPRANTNLPGLVVGLRIAERLVAESNGRVVEKRPT